MPKRAASSPEVIEDSEEERKSKKKSPKKAANVDDPATTADEGDGEEGDGEEDEPEYEVEAITGHKKDKKGVMKYFVKWKGYDEGANTWEPEGNIIEGATEMVQEYWLNYKGKDKPEAKKRVSTGGKPTPKSNSKKTKVESDDDEPPEEPKKRRVSNTGATAEDEDRPKKKQKMVTTMSTEMKKMSSSGLDADQLKAKLAAVADTSITEVPDPDLGTMQPFMHLRTWENMVQSIQTVEAADDKTLRVYFVIKDKETGDERRVVEDSAVCGKKFPQKLIQFYESHLRWRPAEDSA